MSNDAKKPGDTGAKKRGVPAGGLIAVAVAAVLSVLVYNFYTPSPTPTATETTSSGATTATSGSSTTASGTTTSTETSGTSTTSSSTTSASGTAATDTAASGTATDTSAAGGTAATTTADATPVSITPDVAIADLMAPGALPDIVLGDAKAPVTIVEYASMTCPHCARFQTEVMPQLKTKYVDTGKAKMIFREFPLDQLAVAVAMLARCGGEVKFHAFLSTMFKTQLTWATGEGSPLPKLKEIAKQAGFTDESFDKCLADEALQKNILDIRARADEKFGITGTPTFFINGIKLKDGSELEDFDKVMKALGQG